MPSPAMRSVPAFVPQALVASQVGTWETDTAHAHVVADAVTAGLFGVDADDAAQGLPLTVYAQAIHPADHAAFFHEIDRVRLRGGLFVVEYRTCPAPGAVRWVLARGRYEHDPRTGDTTGRGIVIDITESKHDGRMEERAFFVAPQADEGPLERAAAHAIAVRHAIDEAGDGEPPTLRRAVDALLWAIGRTLARRGDDAAR